MEHKRIPLIRRPSWTFSKTQIFAVALIIFGALQANMEVFSPFLNEKTVGWLTSVIGVIVYILRAVTINSLGDKILEHRGTGKQYQRLERYRPYEDARPTGEIDNPDSEESK